MTQQKWGGAVLFAVLRLTLLLGAVLTLLFFLQRLTGDPATVLVGHGATPDMLAAVRQDMGLNEPLFTQYAIFMQKAALLDFGDSIRSQRPALEMVLARFPATLLLSVSAIVLAIVFGVPLGVYAAIFHKRWDGRLVNLIAGVMQSMPNFWLGLILLLIFSVNLHWFGSVASLEENILKRIALPAITLSSFYMARLIRMVRSGLMEEMHQPYVLTARGKGLSSSSVFFGHIFRNTLIPVMSFVTLDLSIMLGGSVIVETMFSYSGIGDQMVQGILNRDYPIVQATVFVVAVVVFTVNSAARSVNRLVDPRMVAV